MTELRFVSSRGGATPVSLSQAMAQGLAPDGGLYIPTQHAAGRCVGNPAGRGPTASRTHCSGAIFRRRRIATACSARSPRQRLASARSDDRSSRQRAIRCLFWSSITAQPPLSRTSARAFWRSACSDLQPAAPAAPLTILVATSGDTGGAVAAAFHRRAWARVVILYPKGLVSPRQEQQLTCWGDNVLSLRIDGTFDDCQRIGEGGISRSRI